MRNRPWWPLKNGFRYVVVKTVDEDFLGATVRFYRYVDDTVARFWFRKNAEKLADRLNKERIV